MLPNILFLLGALFIAAGAYVKFNSKPAIQAAAKPEKIELVEKAPTKIDEGLSKGHAFENWVVSKFRSDSFKLLEWRSDKEADTGKRPENSKLPDIEMELLLNEESYQFAVECKWRANYSGNNLKFSYDEQLRRYRAFSKDKKVPVILAIGVGGQPDEPAHLYCIPLHKVRGPEMTKKELEPYKQGMTYVGFYYDVFRKELRL